MFRSLVLLLCSLCCVASSLRQDPVSLSAKPDSEADEVYAAVVSWRVGHPGEGPSPKALVFLDTTVPYHCLGSDSEKCAGDTKNLLAASFGKDLSPELLNDYMARNAITAPMSQSVPTDLPKFWMSSAEENALFSDKKHDGWEAFYKKYPKAGGFMGFSQVGFNPAHDRALLYSQISCGWLCGTGHYFLLKKDSGKWTLSKGFMAWIS